MINAEIARLAVANDHVPGNIDLVEIDIARSRHRLIPSTSVSGAHDAATWHTHTQAPGHVARSNWVVSRAVTVKFRE